MTDKKNGVEQPAGSADGKQEAPSAFGDKSKDADALWASLAAEIPAPDDSVAAEPAVAPETAAVTEPEAGAAPEKGVLPETGTASAQESAASSADTDAEPSPEETPAQSSAWETLGALDLPEPGVENPAGVSHDSASPDGQDANEAKSGKKKKAPKPKTLSVGPFGGKTLGPVLPSVALMKDEDGNLVPTPPTVTSRIFSGLSLLPILLPLVLLLAQVALTLDVRSLWYSDEVRYADAYRNMGATGDWLVLQLNGAMYPDKPPMFFWLLHGIKELAAYIGPVLPFAVTETMIFFTGVAVSGILCLFAAHLLASLVGRVDRRTVLAADLILVGSFFFAGLLHYLRMDLLFTALITFSHVFLFHALVRAKAPLLMLLAFLCAGAAVLVKGPLGFAFPLLAGLCFLLWQGRFTRIFKLDFIFALIAGLAVPGAWLALAWMNAGDAFLDNILHKQVLARALNTWHHGEPWYHYLMTFPLIWLPWTLLLFFLPWGRFMGKAMREGLKASRTTEGAGIAYLWCAVLPGFILLSAVSIKIPIYCLPLFPPLAVLSARAILRMRPFAAACLQWSLAVLLALLGLCLLLLPMVPGGMLPIPYIPKGTMILGGVCLVFACMLAFLVKSRRGEGMVLLVALFTTVFAYPVWSITAPSLDEFLSPRGQAEIVKKYKDAGYAVATFKVYPGTYTYYAGNVIDCETYEEALAVAAKNPKTLLALRVKFWDALVKDPEGFVEVDRRRIAERAYVLVARPPLDPALDPAGPETPATEPETPDSAGAPPAESASDPASAPATEPGADGAGNVPGESTETAPAPSGSGAAPGVSPSPESAPAPAPEVPPAADSAPPAPSAPTSGQ